MAVQRWKHSPRRILALLRRNPPPTRTLGPAAGRRFRGGERRLTRVLSPGSVLSSPLRHARRSLSRSLRAVKSGCCARPWLPLLRRLLLPLRRRRRPRPAPPAEAPPPRVGILHGRRTQEQREQPRELREQPRERERRERQDLQGLRDPEKRRRRRRHHLARSRHRPRTRPSSSFGLGSRRRRTGWTRPATRRGARRPRRASWSGAPCRASG